MLSYTVICGKRAIVLEDITGVTGFCGNAGPDCRVDKGFVANPDMPGIWRHKPATRLRIVDFPAPLSPRRTSVPLSGIRMIR
jgi:hypothetical protein